MIQTDFFAYLMSMAASFSMMPMTSFSTKPGTSSGTGVFGWKLRIQHGFLENYVQYIHISFITIYIKQAYYPD